MRADILGIGIDLLTMDESIIRCVELIQSGVAARQASVNAGKIVMSRDVPGLREVIADCDLVNADGQSIVWAGRLLGAQVPERVAGIDLMERLIAVAEMRQWPVFFLGAQQEVLDDFLVRIKERHPGLILAGHRNGYFSDPAEITESVRESGARLLFVGLPSPRKEFFLADHISAMGPLFAMGVGGSFDVVAGRTGRAPLWMQRSGLEWLYRFTHEPRRMWRRYLIGNARFAWLFTEHALNGRR